MELDFSSGVGLLGGTGLSGGARPPGGAELS